MNVLNFLLKGAESAQSAFGAPGGTPANGVTGGSGVPSGQPQDDSLPGAAAQSDFARTLAASVVDDDALGDASLPLPAWSTLVPDAQPEPAQESGTTADPQAGVWSMGLLLAQSVLAQGPVDVADPAPAGEEGRLAGFGGDGAVVHAPIQAQAQASGMQADDRLTRPPLGMTDVAMLVPAARAAGAPSAHVTDAVSLRGLASTGQTGMSAGTDLASAAPDAPTVPPLSGTEPAPAPFVRREASPTGGGTEPSGAAALRGVPDWLARATSGAPASVAQPAVPAAGVKAFLSGASQAINTTRSAHSALSAAAGAATDRMQDPASHSQSVPMAFDMAQVAPPTAVYVASLAPAPNRATGPSPHGLPSGAMAAEAQQLRMLDAQTGAAGAAAVPEPAGFASELADQVSWWLSQKTQGAEMTLDGPGGEPVTVSVQVQGNEAHIAFRSDQALTRQMLSGALPQLEQMLGDSGLMLGQVSVGAGSAGRDERQTPGAQRAWEQERGVSGAGLAPDDLRADAAQRPGSSGSLRGGVNLYV